jgi:hypothetical protein
MKNTKIFEIFGKFEKSATYYKKSFSKNCNSYYKKLKKFAKITKADTKNTKNTKRKNLGVGLKEALGKSLGHSDTKNTKISSSFVRIILIFLF